MRVPANCKIRSTRARRTRFSLLPATATRGIGPRIKQRAGDRTQRFRKPPCYPFRPRLALASERARARARAWRRESSPRIGRCDRSSVYLVGSQTMRRTHTHTHTHRVYIIYYCYTLHAVYNVRRVQLRFNILYRAASRLKASRL